MIGFHVNGCITAVTGDTADFGSADRTDDL